MLKRARVRGYKCLEDVTVDLEPFTVLIGRNDSGKSSFLQAIAELTRCARSSLPSRGHGLRVRLDGATRSAELFSGPSTLGIAVGVPDEEALTTPFALHKPLTADRWNDEYGELNTSEPLVLDAASVAERAENSWRTIEEFVARRGGGTAAYLAALALRDRERFDLIEKALRDVTKGRVASLVVDDVGNSTYALSFRLFDRTVIAAGDLSQGLLLYLAFLSIVHRDPVPATLLVEEPETGLHPFRLFEVVSLLRSLNDRGVQVILTTHSPDLLSACKPHEVRVFSRPTPESSTRVDVLPPDFERRAMRETLGEVWASRGEEGLLDRPNGPIVPSVQAEPK